MKHNKSGEFHEVFPRKGLIFSFLAVTMMLIFGTAISIVTAGNIYFDAGPETEIIVGWFMVSVFCLVNFKVTRGSFLCAKILRYYALALALICIPSLFSADTKGEQIFACTNIAMLFGVFYLIGGKTYQEMVQNRHDFCKEMIELRETREAIIAMNNKRRKN